MPLRLIETGRARTGRARFRSAKSFYDDAVTRQTRIWTHECEELVSFGLTGGRSEPAVRVIMRFDDSAERAVADADVPSPLVRLANILIHEVPLNMW